MQYLDFNENKRRGTHDFPFAFYHVDELHPQYVMPFHWHVEYELIRITRGSLLVSLDEQEFCATAGDVLFIGGGILHAGIPNQCTYECIVFDMNTFLDHNNACAKLVQTIIAHSILIHHHFLPNNEAVHQVVWNIFDAMSAKREGYQLTLIGEFYHFFGIVYENHLYLTNTKQTPRIQKRILQLKEVLEFIETSYASAVTLQQLSDIVNMSPKYFCKFFFDMTHQTPMNYVNSYRIERASHLLITTDMPVTEIALSCGFNDTSYFIKTFRKQKGSTPKKFMKQSPILPANKIHSMNASLLSPSFSP